MRRTGGCRRDQPGQASAWKKAQAGRRIGKPTWLSVPIAGIAAALVWSTGGAQSLTAVPAQSYPAQISLTLGEPDKMRKWKVSGDDQAGYGRAGVVVAGHGEQAYRSCSSARHR